MFVLTRSSFFIHTVYECKHIFASVLKGGVKLCHLTRSDVVVTEKRGRLILVGVLVSFGVILLLNIDYGPVV